MRILKWSKLWFIATVFALLGLVSAPALAFSCCCDFGAQDTVTAQAKSFSTLHQAMSHGAQTKTSVPSVAPSAGMPCCDHCPMTETAAQPRLSTQAYASTLTAARVQFAVTKRCACSHDTSDLVGLSASAFSEFVPFAASLPVPVHRVSLDAPRSSVRLAFASPASLPRGPDTASLPSRAPPVLALS